MDRLMESCAWHTRESAEAVSDVLHAAEFAMHPARSSQTALQLTFRLLRKSFEVQSSGSARRGEGEGGRRAHALELYVNRRLASRKDFAEKVGSRAARWRPPTGFYVC